MTKPLPRRLLPAFLAASLLAFAGPASALGGRVVDAATGQPLAGAIVTRGEVVTTTDAAGRYAFAGNGTAPVAARAIGYGRASVAPPASGDAPDLRLAAFRPKALYLSLFGIGDRGLRHAALDLLDKTELNALVIDVKGDRGLIGYRSGVALAGQIGARRVTTVNDMAEMIRDLKAKGAYLIARIVVFKDDPLATARPDLAVKNAQGQPFRDLEGLAWVDPAKPEVWAYDLDIAAEAAELGFDEIQFDYVRFPDAKGIVFSVPDTEEQRVAAIGGFLAAARKRLARYNVFVAADIFGYVCWNTNDTFIGQRLDTLVAHLDYLSPMLYPSGFRYGIPGYTNPVANPTEIVGLTLKRAIARTGVSPLRFRPWLQAFRDYAFDHRVFDAEAIRKQIDAAEATGSSGWMLWNPRNAYTAAGLKP